MAHIELPIGFVGNVKDEDFKAYCKHFDCIAVKHCNTWTIQSDEPINFFWMGINMNFRSDSRLCETPADKYLKTTTS